MIKSLYVIANEAKASLLIGVISSFHQQKMFIEEGFKQAFAAKYEDLKKRNYVLFPSEEPDTSIVGLYKFIEEESQSKHLVEAAEAERIASCELPVESYSEDSLTDSEEESERMIKLYLSNDESVSEEWLTSEDEEESYKDIKKLTVEYHEEMSEVEEEEEEELGEYSGSTDLYEEEFLSE